MLGKNINVFSIKWEHMNTREIDNEDTEGDIDD